MAEEETVEELRRRYESYSERSLRGILSVVDLEPFKRELIEEILAERAVGVKRLVIEPPLEPRVLSIEDLREWTIDNLLFFVQDRATLPEERAAAIEVLAERGISIPPCPDHPDDPLIPMLEIDGVVLDEYGLEVWVCPKDNKWYWRDLKGRIRPTRRNLILSKVRADRVVRAPPPPEVPFVEITFRGLMPKLKPELEGIAIEIEEPSDELAQFFYNRDVWNPEWGAPAAYGIDEYYMSMRGRESYLRIVERYGSDTTGANLPVMYRNGIWHKGWGDPRLHKLPPVPKGAGKTDEVYIW